MICKCFLANVIWRNIVVTFCSQCSQDICVECFHVMSQKRSQNIWTSGAVTNHEINTNPLLRFVETYFLMMCCVTHFCKEMRIRLQLNCWQMNTAIHPQHTGIVAAGRDFFVNEQLCYMKCHVRLSDVNHLSCVTPRNLRPETGVWYFII